MCYCSTDNGYSPKCPDLPFFPMADTHYGVNPLVFRGLDRILALDGQHSSFSPALLRTVGEFVHDKVLRCSSL